MPYTYLLVNNYNVTLLCSKADDTGTKVEADGIVIKHVIRQHQARPIQSTDHEDVQRIHIKRSCVFSDALRQFAT